MKNSIVTDLKSVSSGITSKVISMYVVPIKVSHRETEKEISTYAMLDSCSQGCFIKDNIKNVGERSTAKNYHPVSLLSVVSKVFEKLINNRIVDHLEKCGLFSDFQYGFRSS